MEPATILRKTPTPRGFTIVELVMVLAIVAIISVVIYSGQASFNKALLVTDTAYQIALSVREAQTFGLSSRKFTTGTTNAGYGLTFTNGNTASYSVFADVLATGAIPTSPVASTSFCPTGIGGTPEAKPGNCQYDSAGEILRTYQLNQGFRITDVCGTDTNNTTKYCFSDSPVPLQSLDIVFLRPNTESIVTGTRSNSKIELMCATIHVKSPENVEKCVVVSPVGEVSVPQTCPAPSLQTCP